MKNKEILKEIMTQMKEHDAATVALSKELLETKRVQLEDRQDVLQIKHTIWIAIATLTTLLTIIEVASTYLKG